MAALPLKSSPGRRWGWTLWRGVRSMWELSLRGSLWVVLGKGSNVVSGEPSGKG